MIVGQAGGGADGLIVLFTGGEHQDVLALQRVGDGGEQLGVLFDVLAAHHDYGHGNGVGHGLRQRDAVCDRDIVAVGIGALKVQTDRGSTLHRLGLFRHVHDGFTAGVEVQQAGRNDAREALVGNLDGDLGLVLNGRVEGVEGQYVFAADHDALVARAEGDGIDPGIERLLFRSESHVVFPLFVVVAESAAVGRAS